LTRTASVGLRAAASPNASRDLDRVLFHVVENHHSSTTNDLGSFGENTTRKGKLFLPASIVPFVDVNVSRNSLNGGSRCAFHN
jgi:hypothetical protein